MLESENKLGGATMNAPAELYACIYVRELPAQALLRLPQIYTRDPAWFSKVSRQQRRSAP